MTNKQDVLETALNLVTKDRNQTHGDPKENFSDTALLWSTYLGFPISAEQVTMCQVLLKVSRTKFGKFNQDDYIDMAGYAALSCELAPQIPANIGIEAQELLGTSTLTYTPETQRSAGEFKDALDQMFNPGVG